MQARTFHLDILPVQEEAFVLIETDGPHPETGRVTVYHLSLLFQYCFQTIKIRFFQIPQLWVGQRERLCNIFCPVFRHHNLCSGCILLAVYLQQIALCIHYSLHNFYFTGQCRSIGYSCYTRYDGRFCRHSGSGNICTPHLDMYRIGYLHPYVAINTRASVPARFLRMIYLHAQCILSSIFQVRSQVSFK